MKLHHTALTVRSLSESITFYTDFFGFSIEHQAERKDLGCKIVMMENDLGQKIELFEFENTEAVTEKMPLNRQGITHIAFEVIDLEKVARDFEAKGFEIKITTGVIARYFFIQDPTGINIELYQKI